MMAVFFIGLWGGLVGVEGKVEAGRKKRMIMAW
jgi:hypothetical protein